MLLTNTKNKVPKYNMNKASILKQQNNGMLVTQPYVPDIIKYMKYVEQAFNSKWLTNGGPLLEELTLRLKELLKLEYLLLVNNGTNALQIAYQTKDLSEKTALTTPFTFPATSNAMHWQNTNVEFADIDKNSWNLCPSSVAQALKRKAIDAIVPVNIFGTACNMEDFDRLAKQHDIPVIYDSAQSMLSNFKGKSIFEYGDIHCISFHATKLFHCVEGGALAFKEKSDYDRAKRLINFGFDQQGYVVEPGLNSKMSELHAAMGLCVLDELPILIDDRENSIDCYKKRTQRPCRISNNQL